MERKKWFEMEDEIGQACLEEFLVNSRINSLTFLEKFFARPPLGITMQQLVPVKQPQSMETSRPPGNEK